MTLAACSLSGSLFTDDFQVLLDSSDTVLHPAAVGFQLGFAFAAAHPDATLLPRQVTPEAGKAGEQMLQLRQLNLELAFPGASTLREDVQNQSGAVQHFALEDFFQIPRLGRRKFVVENNGI